jgi:chromosome segregation ATPase
MSNDLQQQVHRVNEKLQQLLKQYQLLQKENEVLKKDLKDVRGINSEKGRQLDELEQKVSILKTATNNLTDADKKQLEKRLNGYIKEIDRCITMLNQ